MRLMGQRDLCMLSSIIGTIFGACLGYIRAMFWLFLHYICFYMPEMAKIFTKESCMPIRNYSLMLTYLDHIRALFGQFFDNFYIFNYSYINRTCIILFNGYFGIVW